MPKFTKKIDLWPLQVRQMEQKNCHNENGQIDQKTEIVCVMRIIVGNKIQKTTEIV